MPFSIRVRTEALVRCGRHCCLCHRFVGLKIEVHHIDPSRVSGNNTLDNAIALCFDCHADMINYDPKHPKGTKYTVEELKMHRDAWYGQVQDGNISSISNENFAHDKKVFEWFVRELPWFPVLEYLHKHDFGDEFHKDIVSKLSGIAQEFADPMKCFVDPTLEGLRASFAANSEDFLNYISQFAFLTENTDWLKLPGELGSDGDQSSDDSFYEKRKALNCKATCTVKSYRSLIDEAKRRIG